MSSENPLPQDRLDSLLKTMSRVNEAFVQGLANASPDVKEYLQKERGITKEVSDKFQIGYSKVFFGKSYLQDFFPDLLSNDDLVDLDVIRRPKGENSKAFDVFYGRLTIPVKNEGGQILGFTARHTYTSKALETSPTLSEKSRERLKKTKYINTSETPLFKKRDLLFGLYDAKDAITTSKSVITVEGAFDVIAMHQFGYSNTVAPLGAGLSQQQISRLFDLADVIYFGGDADSAGRRSILKMIKAYAPELKAGKSMRVLDYGTYKDPDEMLHSDDGAAKMKSCIDKSLSISEFLLTYFKSISDLNSAESLSSFLKSTVEIVNSISSKQVRDQLFEDLKTEPRIYESLQEVLQIPNPAPKEYKADSQPALSNSEQSGDGNVVPMPLKTPLKSMAGQSGVAVLLNGATPAGKIGSGGIGDVGDLDDDAQIDNRVHLTGTPSVNEAVGTASVNKTGSAKTSRTNDPASSCAPRVKKAVDWNLERVSEVSLDWVLRNPADSYVLSKLATVIHEHADENLGHFSRKIKNTFSLDGSQLTDLIENEYPLNSIKNSLQSYQDVKFEISKICIAWYSDKLNKITSDPGCLLKNRNEYLCLFETIKALKLEQIMPGRSVTRDENQIGELRIDQSHRSPQIEKNGFKL